MGHLYFNIIHDHSLPKTSRGLRRFFGAYINCPEQNFSDPNNLRPSTLKTNPGQPLLRSDGRCVFWKRATDKISFYKLDEMSNFRFQVHPFFSGTSSPDGCWGRQLGAKSTLAYLGGDVPGKKQTYLKTKIARLIKFIK